MFCVGSYFTADIFEQLASQSTQYNIVTLLDAAYKSEIIRKLQTRFEIYVMEVGLQESGLTEHHPLLFPDLVAKTMTDWDINLQYDKRQDTAKFR